MIKLEAYMNNAPSLWFPKLELNQLIRGIKRQ